MMQQAHSNRIIPGNRGAVLAMVGASALIAVTSLLAKKLGVGEGLHPMQISAGRFFFAFLVVASVSAWRRPSLKGADWPRHFGRSACGWLGVTCMFAAAARMPLSDATAISFLSPVVTMLLAVLILREIVGPSRWLAVGLALLGALVLIRPGTEAFQPAALVALAAALFMGTESILIKQLTGNEPPLRILLINNGFGMLIACTAALFVWRWPTADEWALLALLGFAMVCAQTLFIQAMKRGHASQVIPAFYSTLVFATLYDFAIFGVIPDGIALTGAAMILGGVLLLVRPVRV
ncbi:DMT family transporter [Minwuia sp.]|uniref:DMT family transporter n=1 Tax=Minwuia sp. TaxID=2493630 RepID=UPI003A91B834